MTKVEFVLEMELEGGGDVDAEEEAVLEDALLAEVTPRIDAVCHTGPLQK